MLPRVAACNAKQGRHAGSRAEMGMSDHRFRRMQVDHMRAVGPGVYVGVGWKAPREDKVELGRRFLPFMLVREYND